MLKNSEVAVSGVVDNVIATKPESGFAVLAVRLGGGDRLVTMIGEVIDARPGQLLRAEGMWQDSKVWGRQFKAKSIHLLAPSTPEGIASFLASGIVKGVGEKAAAKLVEAFGESLPEILDSDPEKLQKIEGIGPKTAARIAEAWSVEKGSREILMFLHTHGVRPSRAQKILETYGQQAVTQLLKDPYLLSKDIKGIGFQTADALATNLGIARDAKVRRIAAMNEALRQASLDGQSALRQDQAFRAAADLLDVDVASIVEVGEQIVNERQLIETIVEGESFLQLPELFQAEQSIASEVFRLSHEEPDFEDGDGHSEIEPGGELALSDGQRSALAGIRQSKVTIVTGGPGTGKTTLIRAMLATLTQAEREIVLCAPTGRAARRMTESTGQPASTIHRLLEADPNRGFGRNAARKIEADLVVVDEFSMVDTLLFHALLQALPPHAALILVGDVDQLPPVGPGQPLADLIESHLVPVFRLSEIFRQAAESGIVRNAHAINRGEMPTFKSMVSPDCFGVRANHARDALEKLLELVQFRIPERFELNAIADIQVLTPVNRGPAGTQELNARLQATLNPEPSATIERAGVRFSVGDKVMQTENDNNREVYNGDVGQIVAVDERARIIDVKFEDKTLLYNHDTLEQLQLAYAVTVHKSQGSEYPAVVLLLMREHGRMLRRQLLYTAMTRARNLLIVIAQSDALQRAVTTTLPPRHSLLIPTMQSLWETASS